ncbi:type II toxin-antitoxin system VapC family toxin [[Phormidium] sp. LEGE 05292]|uniref:type II toxin-antitoxin system VapC family toxin n=1 Tax=[Phormidium] sp. LEGE 05292 TaxID=767427 RepID=UPI001D14F7BD|nr:hypothetical protein [Phormidium sp. LEGE 05292]
MCIASRQLTKRHQGLSALPNVNDFKVLPILPFDAGAATTFEQLKTQRIQLAKMDARIAAIALSRGLILLTRNHLSLSQKACLLMLASSTISGSAIANCTFFPNLPKLRASRATWYDSQEPVPPAPISQKLIESVCLIIKEEACK